MIVYDPYATVPFADLVADLVYDVTDLPTDAAVHYLRRSAIQLARSSNALVRRACVSVHPHVEEYKLLPPGCEEDIVAIMSATGQGCGAALRRIRSRPADSGCSWCATPVTWFEEPDSLFVRTWGAGGMEVRVEFSVAPTPTACAVDAAFARKFYETLMAGAKSMIFELVDKPWTNQGRAQKYGMQYALGASDAAAETMMGGQRGAFRSFRNPVV